MADILKQKEKTQALAIIAPYELDKLLFEETPEKKDGGDNGKGVSSQD